MGMMDGLSVNGDRNDVVNPPSMIKYQCKGEDIHGQEPILL